MLLCQTSHERKTIWGGSGPYEVTVRDKGTGQEARVDGDQIVSISSHGPPIAWGNIAILESSVHLIGGQADLYILLLDALGDVLGQDGVRSIPGVLIAAENFMPMAQQRLQSRV